jgi:hypothetical protein
MAAGDVAAGCMMMMTMTKMIIWLLVTFSGSHQSTNLPTTTFRIIGVCVRLSIINKPDVFASNNATGVTYSWRFDCTLIRLEEVSHQ